MIAARGHSGALDGPAGTGPPGRRIAALVCAVCLIALAVPVAALATTGTATDKRSVVTITDKGVTWTPNLAKLKVETGTTVRLDVVNKTSQKHWFQVGTKSVGLRRTKVLGPGASYVFFYVFDTTGEIPFQIGLGNVSAAGFHGTVKVVFPPHFN
jgi:hypothetical protein